MEVVWYSCISAHRKLDRQVRISEERRSSNVPECGIFVGIRDLREHVPKLCDGGTEECLNMRLSVIQTDEGGL